MRWAVATLCLAAFALRASRCLFAEEAVVHPDQVFQALEPAHIVRYGYGMISLEFAPVVALRSYLPALFYAAAMGAGEALGGSYARGLWAARLAHTAVASLLPAAVAELALAVGAGDDAALLAAALVALHDVLVGLGSVTQSISLVSPLLLYALALLVGGKRSVRAGFLLGLCHVVRPDAAVLSLLVAAFAGALSLRERLLRVAPRALVGWVGGQALGAAVDSFLYGRPTYTPLNWLQYNVVQGLSALHGVSSWDFYFSEILLRNRSFLYAVVFSLAIAGTEALRRRRGAAVEGRKHALLQLALISGLALAVLSSVGHKEVRFAHDVVALLCLFVAVAMTFAVDEVAGLLPTAAGRSAWVSIAALLVAVTLADTDLSVMYAQQAGAADLNAALAAVGGSGSVTGVVVLGDWWKTGGYSTLHAPVPCTFFTVEPDGGLRRLLVLPKPESNAWYLEASTERHNTFADFGDKDASKALQDLRMNFIVWDGPMLDEIALTIWQYGFDPAPTDEGGRGALGGSFGAVRVYERSKRMTELIRTHGPHEIAADRARTGSTPPPGTATPQTKSKGAARSPPG